MYKEPMLCNKYSGRNADLPLYIQPKLNGIRCMFDGRDAWTRNLKQHKPHIIQMLCDSVHVPNGVEFLDGELMLPHPYTFEDIVSAVKRDQPLSRQLTYNVYDCCAEGAFTHRLSVLNTWTISLLFEGMAKMVCTHYATCGAFTPKDVVNAWHYRLTAMGYEGIILRTPSGHYQHGLAGRDLLKYKKMLDAEFEIVDVLEATGKDVGTPVFVCVTESGGKFNVRPKGSVASRRQMWEDRASLIGKKLTVQYQNFSAGGTPVFPVGIAVRDYE